MKKSLILLTLIFIPMCLHAQPLLLIADGFELLTILVSLVVVVLNIILFFKIWIMTNHVSEIHRKFVISPSSIGDNSLGARFFACKATFGSEAADMMLKNELESQIKQLFSESCTKEEAIKMLQQMNSSLEYVLIHSGVTLPQEDLVNEFFVDEYNEYKLGNTVFYNAYEYRLVGIMPYTNSVAIQYKDNNPFICDMSSIKLVAN